MNDYQTPKSIQKWWKPWYGYVFALIGFTWASLGFFNEYFNFGLPKPFFSKYSEIFVIVLYGLPIIFIIRDKYQKIRISVLVSLLFLFWYVIPVHFPFLVHLPGVEAATFPSFEVPGTWTNIVILSICLLFGRRVKCGWMNTCVALKETAGASFRKFTKRDDLAFKLRYIKYATTFCYLIVIILLFFPQSRWKEAFLFCFWTTVAIVYFSTLYIAPFFGSRAWCRWVCPFMLGWTNVLGFFRINVNRNKCTECGLCEKNCDFGLPIRKLSKKNPRIRTTECMGCGRCRSICPQNAISYYDVRDFLYEKIMRIKKKPVYYEVIKGKRKPALKSMKKHKVLELENKER